MSSNKASKECDFRLLNFLFIAWSSVACNEELRWSNFQCWGVVSCFSRVIRNAEPTAEYVA